MWTVAKVKKCAKVRKCVQKAKEVGKIKVKCVLIIEKVCLNLKNVNGKKIKKIIAQKRGVIKQVPRDCFTAVKKLTNLSLCLTT